ncbi:MAG TPA: lanthionine synthetase C family protein [Holophagaceae bacterium]|nr:lanthionine synthetase C family protein [Holophagaceae bacterium]
MNTAIDPRAKPDRLTTPRPAGCWRPLLDGADALQAWGLIESIASTLAQEEVLDALPIGLHRGLSGVAIFFTQLALARPGLGWEALAQDLIARSVDRLGETDMLIRFMDGFPGVAWSVDQVQSHLAGPDDDVNEDVDEVLQRFMDIGPRPAAFDLISGLVGFGVYGLGRAGKGSGRAIAEQVVRDLERESVVTDLGITWHSAPQFLPSWQREMNPEGHFDLGISHGVSGVIAFLAQAFAVGVEADRARRLLEGAVPWLLAQRYPTEEALRFPRLRNGRGEAEPVRYGVSWCYGDLSASIALLGAARRIGRSDWETEALDLARRMSARTPATVDMPATGLCHGAIGAAHLFNRLFQATGEPAFEAAARAWITETFVRWDGLKLTGMESIDYPDMPAWYCDAGFLVGWAGVGLGLLAAVTAQEPVWDRMMLMDLPA